MWKRSVGLAVACLVGAAGCTQDTTSGPTGAVEIGLEIGGTAEIDEVVFTIFGNDMPPMSGTIDTSAPGATASVEVFGLPEGTGYRVELVAAIGDGEPCRGSAPFSIVAGQVTPVMVMLNCKPEERFGSVRVNGKLNICAHLAKVVVAPLQTSVGSRIELFLEAADAEGDFVELFWSAARGQVVNPRSPATSYVCTSEGTDFIEAFVSDDEFRDCIDSWRVEVRCVAGDGGTGGSGGAGGSGGTGGVPACVPSNDQCENATIDPIQEDPACMLNEPPSLPGACLGDESVVNVTSCTPTGNTSLHQIQLMQVVGDCNVGYDLDSCAGDSCDLGGLAQGEGVNGVDNQLAALGPLLQSVGGNLGGVDQALYDGLCDGSIDLALEVDPNPAEGCIIVTPVIDGSPANPVLMNLSDRGCVSGALGTIPVPVAGVQGQIDNALIRGTADVTRGFNVILGGTVAGDTARAIADALLDGGSAVVSQVFDIRTNLAGDVSVACDAVSISLDVGGTLVSDAGGACTDPANAAVYANLEFTDGNGVMTSGTDAAGAITRACLRGSVTSVPTIAGCGQETIEVVSCFPSCPPEPIEALADCVAQCTRAATAEIASPGLSAACVECTGEGTACAAAFCTDVCVVDLSAPACVACQCENDCIPSTALCTGIPSTACDR